MAGDIAHAGVGDLVAAIDHRVPFSKAGGWDAVGLQLGDPAAPVNTVAVCHEVSDETVMAAVARDVDVLVTYHPLLFTPTKRFVAGSTPGGRAHRLVSAGIALIAVHTAYDVAPGGVADALAETLGLRQISPFGPNFGPGTAKVVTFVPEGSQSAVVAAMAAAGAGTIGQYSEAAFSVAGTGSYRPSSVADPAIGTPGEPSSAAEVRIEMVAPSPAVDAVVAALVGAHPYEEPAYDVSDHRGNAGFIGRRGRVARDGDLGTFARHIEEALTTTVRVAGDPHRPVEWVSVIPGSGRSFLDAAARTDVVVTGDIGHHDANRALARGQAIVDAGHAATERPGMATLYALVREIAATLDDVVAVDLTAIDPTPWSREWRR